MKNSLKISLKVLAIMLITMMLFSTICRVSGFSPNEIINQMEQDASEANPDMGTISTKAGTILAYIRNIAVIVAIIVIAILGIKYIIGSVEQKAEYKKNFIPLIVGIVVVVLAAQIATVIFNVVK